MIEMSVGPFWCPSR